MDRPVVLVGIMGSGKSTVGPSLARRLGRPFVDVDEAVEAAAGCTIADLFASEGEEGFRRRETAALARALEGPAAVVACGGGIVVDDANRVMLAERAWVAWLRVPPEVAAERVGRDRRRPLLGDDPLASLRRVLGEREERYREAADVEVDASRPAAEVVAELAAMVVADAGAGRGG